MRRMVATAIVLLMVLSACGVPRGLLTPEPTVSVIPTPQPVMPQAYLPLVLRHYPRVARGVGGGTFGLIDAPYHHWTISPLKCDPQFVRTVWCLTDFHLTLYEPEIVYAAEHCPGGDWLFLNEPDDSGGRVVGGQCGAYPLTGNPLDPENPAPTIFEAPAATAIRFSATYDLLKAHDPTARVFVGGMGWIGHQISRDWWTRFVAELARRGELWKIEGIHFHAYPYGSFPTWGMQAFEDGVADWVAFNAGLGLGDRELWITETGGGSCTRWERWDARAWTTIRDETMLPMQRWMDIQATGLGITRVFWFVSWDGVGASWWCNYLVDGREAPVLTALGDAWR